MKKQIKKYKKKFPRISIERVGIDDKGHIIYIDIHDELFGEAIFFSEGSRHSHGFLNGGNFSD
jgi:hypothetical protein